MIDKLQQLKGKTKLELYKNISNYFDEMKHKNFPTQEDPFAKNAQGISKIYQEVFLLMKFVQAKPLVKNMKNYFYDLYYTVIEVRDENKDIDNQYENDDNEYINFYGCITPNHYIRIKKKKEILR